MFQLNTTIISKLSNEVTILYDQIIQKYKVISPCFIDMGGYKHATSYHLYESSSEEECIMWCDFNGLNIKPHNKDTLWKFSEICDNYNKKHASHRMMKYPNLDFNALYPQSVPVSK